ncbi:hypothetical protein PT974_07383 [Cladobotryum mycophilum]|uniref:Uncharacterized protein n=1 Tax=Cladobotryum mycophilum TaxID=491253 RepID=A0ABR0SQC6_9HYPO
MPLQNNLRPPRAAFPNAPLLCPTKVIPDEPPCQGPFQSRKTVLVCRVFLHPAIDARALALECFIGSVAPPPS